MKKEYNHTQGDIINNIIILEQIRMIHNVKPNPCTQKGYKVRCLIDDYEFELEETRLKSIEKNNKKTCPVCNGWKIIKGVNSFGDYYPQYVKYFTNKEDAYTHSHKSGKKVLCECTDCGYQKYMMISHISEYGFSCSKCGDKTPYAEKLMYNILQQSGIEFEIQKKFEWLKNKKYDFYLPNYNCIIETHGLQHYKKSTGNFKTKTLKEIKANDKYKKEEALKNGIVNYISLDCSRSSLEFIKNNIMNNKYLTKIIDFNNINWNECNYLSTRPILKDICTLYKKYNNVKDVSIILNKDQNTIRKYLKIGNELGLCSYVPSLKDLERSKQVLSIDESIIYKSARVASEEMSKKYNKDFKHVQIRTSCLSGKSYKGYRFMYLE